MNGYQASFQFNSPTMHTQGKHRGLYRLRACYLGHALDVTENWEEFWVQESVIYRWQDRPSTTGYYNFEGEDNWRQDGTYNGGSVKYMAHLADVERDMENISLFRNKARAIKRSRFREY
ncbi:MAG: hypothetical protein IPN63_07815 [Gammaproteobacteria bacterium]|nr:hypothetical protein [Gammaproteobacteria bacterium]